MKRMRRAPTAEERALLVHLAQARATQPRLARRAQVILLTAEGVSGLDIAACLRLSNGQVSRIRARFQSEGVAGLQERARRGRTDHAVPEAVVLAVLELAASSPPEGRRRWTTRLLAARVGLTSATVSKILRTRTTQRPARRVDVARVTVRG